MSISLLDVVDAARLIRVTLPGTTDAMQIKRNPVDVRSNYRFSLSPDCRAWLNSKHCDKLITSPLKMSYLHVLHNHLQIGGGTDVFSCIILFGSFKLLVTDDINF